MDKIKLDKKQSKAIAQAIYEDIDTYCLENFERYFPFFLNEIRKSKGLPPTESGMCECPIERKERQEGKYAKNKSH